MFPCTSCAKQVAEEGTEEERRRGCGGSGSRTPSTKEAVKTLTAQIKDMALKISGAYRHCKPCTPSRGLRRGHGPHPDSDPMSGVRCHYMGGYSSPLPAWDSARTTYYPASRIDSRLNSAIGGDHTPGGASVSGQSCDEVLQDEDETKEWMAQVEPGVHITFMALPDGGNELKRIRFSRDMFNKFEAQRWWGENYDRIMELYNVQRFNRQSMNTPARSEDERNSSYPRMEPARESPMITHKDWTPRNNYMPSGIKANFPVDYVDKCDNSYPDAGTGAYGANGLKRESSIDAVSRTTTSSREASISVSNASDMETEWVEQDDPGVYITIRQLADGTRELRRVRFSRERFGEVNAKQWWEENRERIQAQYL